MSREWPAVRTDCGPYAAGRSRARSDARFNTWDYWGKPGGGFGGRTGSDLASSAWRTAAARARIAPDAYLHGDRSGDFLLAAPANRSVGMCESSRGQQSRDDGLALQDCLHSLPRPRCASAGRNRAVTRTRSRTCGGVSRSGMANLLNGESGFIPGTGEDRLGRIAGLGATQRLHDPKPAPRSATALTFRWPKLQLIGSVSRAASRTRSREADAGDVRRCPAAVLTGCRVIRWRYRSGNCR
jgi:hypothetical protein